MKFPLARRTNRSPSPSRQLDAGARLFLTLAEEGELALDQRSLPRRVFVFVAVAIYALAVPLFWAATAEGAAADTPQAVLVKAADEDDDDDDDDGPDTTGNNDTGTGAETAAANTDVHQAGVDTGLSTAGETDADNTGATEQTQGTGVETRAANTDRAGVHTAGPSTLGETDPGDHTGKTERR